MNLRPDRKPTKMITYYCERCGGEVQYPDCGAIPAYSDCTHKTCGVKKGLLWRDKDQLLNYLHDDLFYRRKAMCKLLGITMEKMLELGGMPAALHHHGVYGRL